MSIKAGLTEKPVPEPVQCDHCGLTPCRGAHHCSCKERKVKHTYRVQTAGGLWATYDSYTPQFHKADYFTRREAATIVQAMIAAHHHPWVWRAVEYQKILHPKGDLLHHERPLSVGEQQDMSDLRRQV